MKVVNMGNIADAFKFDDLPATGIVIEATLKELKLLPNLAYKDVMISEHVSNAAEMREALEKIASMGEQIDYQLGSSEETVYALRHERCLAHNISECARSALSATPRNCDVGTVAEQNERFDKYCYDHRSHEICCGKCPIFGEPCCELAWSQMPYEEGGAK